MKLKHVLPCSDIGQWDVNPFLEPVKRNGQHMCHG